MEIRAHHLLCIPRFRGKGYNKKIKRGIFNIQKRIKENPNMKIKVIKSCDAVCNACPFMLNKKCVKKPEINHIEIQDNRVIKKLNLKENQIFKARDIFNLSAKIKNKELKQICKGCGYLRFCLKHGLNKSLLNKLK